jgi:hypothetical protein
VQTEVLGPNFIKVWRFQEEILSNPTQIKTLELLGNFIQNPIWLCRSFYGESCSSLQTLQIHILFENFQASEGDLLIKSTQTSLNFVEELESTTVPLGRAQASRPAHATHRPLRWGPTPLTLPSRFPVQPWCDGRRPHRRPCAGERLVATPPRQTGARWPP